MQIHLKREQNYIYQRSRSPKRKEHALHLRSMEIRFRIQWYKSITDSQPVSYGRHNGS